MSDKDSFLFYRREWERYAKQLQRVEDHNRSLRDTLASAPYPSDIQIAENERDEAIAIARMLYERCSYRSPRREARKRLEALGVKL